MRFAVLSSLLAVLAASSVAAFAPAASFTRGCASSELFSSEPEDEEGLDLNLEEMFDMFDAADKEEDFDEAVKKVKGSDE